MNDKRESLQIEVSCQDFWGMLHLPRICCCRAVGKGQRLFSCCWISHQQQSLPSRSPLPWTHVFVFLFWILWLLRFGMKQSCHNREGRGKGHIWNLFLESNKTYNNSRRWRRRRWEKLNVVHHQYTTLYSLTLLTPFTANDNRNGDVSLSLSLSLSYILIPFCVIICARLTMSRFSSSFPFLLEITTRNKLKRLLPHSSKR